MHSSPCAFPPPEMICAQKIVPADRNQVQILTLEDVHTAYAHAHTNWRLWSSQAQETHIVYLSGLADRAADLADHDLADKIESLTETIAADIERRIGPKSAS